MYRLIFPHIRLSVGWSVCQFNTSSGPIGSLSKYSLSSLCILSYTRLKGKTKPVDFNFCTRSNLIDLL